VLVPLGKVWRLGKHAKDAKSRQRASYALREMVSLIDQYNVEDREAGAMSR